MYSLSICLLASIPFGTLVGAHKTVSRSHHRNIARQSGTYSIQDYFQGEDFFTQWSFFTGSDPTNGYVNYLDEQDAMDAGLAYVNGNGATVLAVDSTSTVPVGGNRNSVRITSNSQYNSGLFILDAAAMPVGCSTWPSFWTVGPNWPYGGEIDIVEGVDDQTHNQMTLHSGTSDPCTIDPSNQNTFTGQLLGTNCYSTQDADAGCGISDSSTSSFAYGFNDAGGGVFALLWDTTAGMSMWFFTRSEIPSDIAAQAPTPENWGTPAGLWSAQTCDIADNFYDHSMVIDTTLCGGWAGSAYGSSGCPGTCAEMVANTSNFADAQWVINYVAVYQAN